MNPSFLSNEKSKKDEIESIKKSVILNMSDIKVSKNITITIKDQTFILSDQEATELFNKLKDAGVSDHTIKYPKYPEPHTDWPTPFVPSTPYPSTPVWCTIETAPSSLVRVDDAGLVL